MLSYFRRLKAAMREMDTQDVIRDLAHECEVTVRDTPDLQALTVQGELTHATGQLVAKGIAAISPGTTVKLRMHEDGTWEARDIRGKRVRSDSLKGLIDEVIAATTSYVWVGKISDASFQPEPYDSLAEAEARLEDIRLLDPEGVSKGEYYIDSPEHKVLSGDS